MPSPLPHSTRCAGKGCCSPFPALHGGRGWGTAPAAARDILALLRRIGRESLPLGRVYEGHVNAVRLVVRYGSPDQVARAAVDAASGHLFAIWDAEAADAPVRLLDNRLQGRKARLRRRDRHAQPS